MPVWAYNDVLWGETECQRKSCSAMAEALFEGLPLCIDDAAELIERQAAIDQYPDLREMLPAWDE